MAATAPPTTHTPVDNRLGGAYWRLWTAAVVSRFGDALRTPALALLAAAVTLALITLAAPSRPDYRGVVAGVASAARGERVTHQRREARPARAAPVALTSTSSTEVTRPMSS